MRIASSAENNVQSSSLYPNATDRRCASSQFCRQSVALIPWRVSKLVFFDLLIEIEPMGLRLGVFRVLWERYALTQRFVLLQMDRNIILL